MIRIICREILSPRRVTQPQVLRDCRKRAFSVPAGFNIVCRQDDAAPDNNGFALFYRLAGKHPLAADRRRSYFYARVNPRLQIVFSVWHDTSALRCHHRREHLTPRLSGARGTPTIKCPLIACPVQPVRRRRDGHVHLNQANRHTRYARPASVQLRAPLTKNVSTSGASRAPRPVEQYKQHTPASAQS